LLIYGFSEYFVDVDDEDYLGDLNYVDEIGMHLQI
jgi:hypothetical protein